MVEAEESHAAKRRARDAALAAELDAALSGAFGRSEQPGDAAAAAATTTDASGAEQGSVPLADGGVRPARRRFQRVKMTLSVADAQDAGRVQELVQTVMATSRKRGQTEAGIEAAAAADVATSTDREKGGTGDDDDAPRVRPTKRVTRLDRAPAAAERGVGGAGGARGDEPDAMSDYFRMYDLVCNEQEEGGEDENKEGREKSSGAARKPAGRGLHRGRRGAGATAGGGDERAQRADDDDDDDGEGDKVAPLMCDYMPMVREYLGDGTPAAGEEGDAYVYDVYVQVEDDDAFDDAAADDDGDYGQRGGDTSTIYVGGHDTELFFDAMDGLVDDERDDDVDSQDSNREGADGADYPDEEDSDDDLWDDDGGGGDSDDERRPRRMEGFYGGGHYGGGYDSGDGVDEFAPSGYRPEMSTGYRETAYDPEYDDVTDDNYYS